MSQDFPFKHFFNLESGANKQNIKEVKLDELFTTTRKTNKTTAVLPNIESNFGPEEMEMIHDELHKVLRNSLSIEKYNTYFKGNLKIGDISESSITFTVTTSFLMSVIESKFKEFIETAITDTLGKPYQVHFKLLGDNKFTTAAHQESKKAQSVSDVKFKLKDIQESNEEQLQFTNKKIIEKPIDSFQPDLSKTFDTFVMGPSNNMAYAFAMSVAKEPGKVYPSLFVYGNSGLGKTHLLHSIANYVREKQPELRVLILSSNTFMKEMINAIKDNVIHDFKNRFTDRVDVLIIDDIHELKGKKGTQNAFFDIFNELQSRGKQLIFTSDKHPKEITGIEDRIKTRLSSALSVEIQQPDLETRIAILKKKAMEKDLYLDDEVINLIARCIKTNIRELEGSLIKLGAYSSILNIDIDIEIAKEQLKLSDDLEQKVINIDSIARTVSNYFKINLGDIRGKSRIKDITKARHIAMYLAHQLTKTTLQNIGEYFGHRDHTSVMHGIKKVKKEIKENSQVSQLVYEVESQL